MITASRFHFRHSGSCCRSFMFSSNSDKDYYKLLGVSDSAKKADIKSAFFKLAKKYHPDTNPSAGDKFKDINEAYQVLFDDEKRVDYDRQKQIQRSRSSNYDYSSSGNAQQGRRSYQEQQAQQEPRQQTQNFYYYWEKQNPQGRNSNVNADTAWAQQKDQSEKYKREREQERQREEMRVNEAMRDFVQNMHSGKNPKFNEFQRTYNQQGSGRAQSPWQSAFTAQNFKSAQQYSYDPHDYYQQNWAKQQEKHKENSFYQGQQQNSTRQEEPRRYAEQHYQAAQERQYEEMSINFRREEEQRRQQAYEDWQKKKDEIFFKELTEKFVLVKQNIKEAGKKVEEVAEAATVFTSDFGSKLASFFKKK